MKIEKSTFALAACTLVLCLPLFLVFASTDTSLFSTDFPQSQRFRDELGALRAQGKLKQKNEILINRSLVAASSTVDMPPAILWCLLFQESRLNHLLGVERSHGPYGIGQFNHFGFYEINHHLDRYHKNNLNLFLRTLGKDVRPIEARPKALNNPSSYYFIPTAVVTSASYLNNRYSQLAQVLSKQGIPYDPQLLWFYAVMAYNKGSRSVLSFWNLAQKVWGKEEVRKLVNDREAFQQALGDSAIFARALRKIWPPEEALHYSRELTIHMQNIAECALTSSERSSNP